MANVKLPGVGPRGRVYRRAARTAAVVTQIAYPRVDRGAVADRQRTVPGIAYAKITRAAGIARVHR